MLKIYLLFIGVLVGISFPLGVDYVQYGDFIPCRTVKEFKDGARIQACESKINNL
jgi:hypothetical protein